MGKVKYDQLAENIIGLLGGKDNVTYATHCATRLRFTICEGFGFIGVAIFAAFQPLLVCTGMHQALIPYLTQSFATLGYESFAMPGIVVANINQGMAGLAVAVKTKNTNRRTLATSGAVTALVGGITEPILYGVNLKYKTPMIGIIAGGFVGGSIVGLAGTAGHVLNGGGLLTLSIFIGEHTRNLAMAFIGVVIGMIVTFFITLFLYKDKPEESKDQNVTQSLSRNNVEKSLTVGASAKGSVIPMEDIPDNTFSSGVLGSSCAIEPKDGKVYAPLDGVVYNLADTCMLLESKLTTEWKY